MLEFLLLKMNNDFTLLGLKNCNTFNNKMNFSLALKAAANERDEAD
jgi:hypothetical protein